MIQWIYVKVFKVHKRSPINNCKLFWQNIIAPPSAAFLNTQFAQIIYWDLKNYQLRFIETEVYFQRIKVFTQDKLIKNGNSFLSRSTLTICPSSVYKNQSSNFQSILFPLLISSIYNISPMKNDALKTVEHYSLQHLICTHPDSSQFYQCTHTILKKTYTMRKIEHSVGSKKILTSMESDKRHTEIVYSKIKAQIELNKLLQREGVRKCHKLLRTQRHFYLVYDEFPRLNLRQFIQQNMLTKHQKIELFIKIVSTLHNIHRRGIIIIGITAQTIRVDQNGTIVFTDLSQTRSLQKNQPIRNEQFASLYQQILPDELIDNGIYGTFTDIYMLGKLFNKLISSSSIDSCQRYRKLLSVFREMTQNQYQNRLPLQQVRQQLQNEIHSEQKRSSDTTQPKVVHLMIPNIQSNHKRKYSVHTLSDKSMNSQSERDQSIRNKSLEIQKLNIDVKIQKSIEFKENLLTVPSISSTNEIKSFKQIDTNILPPAMHNIEKHMTMRHIKIGKKLTDMGRKAVQARNLAFFLLDLSQFVMQEWRVPEVAYLLIKKANLTLQECLSKIQMNQQNDFEQRELYQLILSEKVKIAMLLTKIRQIYTHQAVDEQFRMELTDERTINEQYLYYQVKQFGLIMAAQIQKQHQTKIPLKQLAEKLFYVYMLLKKVELGSYQKFWDEIYNQRYAYLSQQRSINDVRRFGYDYLKRKVYNVLKLS